MRTFIAGPTPSMSGIEAMGSRALLGLRTALGVTTIAWMIGSTSAAIAQTRAVASPAAEPAQIIVSQATKVRFYADIADSNVVAGGVNLLRVGAAGSNPAIVGVLRDDGTGGDEIAGDGRYSIELTLTEPVIAPIAFRISAAFRGTLLRTVTPDIVVDVVRNRAPVAVPGSDRSVHAATTVALDGRASYDLDGDLLTFRWTLVRPAGSSAVFDSAS